MDGFAFIEQAFGLAREEWQNNIQSKGGKRRWFFYWNPFFKLAPPVSYTMYSRLFNNRLFILHENGKLIDVGIGEFAKGFCVTPRLVQQALGEPKRIYTAEHSFILTYLTHKNITISIYFLDKNNNYFERGKVDMKNTQEVDGVFREYSPMCAMKIIFRHPEVELMLIE